MSTSSDATATATTRLVQYTAAQEAAGYPASVILAEIDESASWLGIHLRGLPHPDSATLHSQLCDGLCDLGAILPISEVGSLGNVIVFEVNQDLRHQIIEQMLVLIPSLLRPLELMSDRRVFAIRSQQCLVPIRITAEDGATVLHLPPELKLRTEEWQASALVNRIAYEAARYIGYHPKVSMCAGPEERTITIRFSSLRPAVDIMPRLIDEVFRVIELNMQFPEKPAIKPILRAA